jgi:hypothetical protein
VESAVSAPVNAQRDGACHVQSKQREQSVFADIPSDVWHRRVVVFFCFEKEARTAHVVGVSRVLIWQSKMEQSKVTRRQTAAGTARSGPSETESMIEKIIKIDNSILRLDVDGWDVAVSYIAGLNKVPLESGFVTWEDMVDLNQEKFLQYDELDEQ